MQSSWRSITVSAKSSQSSSSKGRGLSSSSKARSRVTSTSLKSTKVQTKSSSSEVHPLSSTFKSVEGSSTRVTCKIQYSTITVTHTTTTSIYPEDVFMLVPSRTSSELGLLWLVGQRLPALINHSFAKRHMPHQVITVFRNLCSSFHRRE